MASIDRRVADAARGQGGHATRSQLLALGMGREQIGYWIEVGRLIPVYRGVYAVGHLPTNPLDRAHRALLACGPRSALAGWSALAFWLRDERLWRQPLELVSAAQRRPRGLVVHVTGGLMRGDMRTINGIRITSPARTALDIAPQTTEQRLERIVNELRHERRLKVEQLRDLAERNRRHPGTKRIERLIGDSQAEHTRSGLEEDFRRLIRRHRLPSPLVNVHVGGHRVDAYFPDHGLVVELDGGVAHGYDWRPAFEDDRARMVDVLMDTGLPTIRFTKDQITKQHAQTALKLRAILERLAVDRPGP